MPITVRGTRAVTERALPMPRRDLAPACTSSGSSRSGSRMGCRGPRRSAKPTPTAIRPRASASSAALGTRGRTCRGTRPREAIPTGHGLAVGVATGPSGRTATSATGPCSRTAPFGPTTKPWPSRSPTSSAPTARTISMSPITGPSVDSVRHVWTLPAGQDARVAGDARVWCGHVSGLVLRPVRPRALMSFALRGPDQCGALEAR